VNCKASGLTGSNTPADDDKTPDDSDGPSPDDETPNDDTPNDDTAQNAEESSEEVKSKPLTTPGGSPVQEGQEQYTKIRSGILNASSILSSTNTRREALEQKLGGGFSGVNFGDFFKKKSGAAENGS
jgi:hypothetical protein